MDGQRISLGYRPRGCRRVRIIGVKANWDDYSVEDRKLIFTQGRVLYPTRFYARPLREAGLKVFPSPRHYYYAGDKIRQTTLFNLLNLPQPRTRIYFGRQSGRISDHFSFPFVAKIPRRSGEGRGVFLIRNQDDLKAYLSLTRVAYIQEYWPLERDLRVVVVAGRLLAAYWRVVPAGGFRANLFQGGTIDLSGLPEEGITFALEAAARCGFDDVGLDVCRHLNRWWLLEANMHYGLKGLEAAGRPLAPFLDRLIEENII